MTPKVIIDLVIGVVVVALVLWLGKSLIDGIQAPAKLDAALGNNAALKAGAEAHNKSVVSLQKDAEARKDKSRKAVAAAGKKEEERVQAILDAKPEGGTDCERATTRIDRELGLQ